jgi:hypothetical protein
MVSLVDLNERLSTQSFYRTTLIVQHRARSDQNFKGHYGEAIVVTSAFAPTGSHHIVSAVVSAGCAAIADGYFSVSLFCAPATIIIGATKAATISNMNLLLMTPL